MAQVPDSVLASIIGIAADGIICVDPEHRITLFNEGAAKIFGYDPNEVLGAPLSMLLPDRYRERHDAHMTGFDRSGDTARHMGERAEVFGRRKNGEEFPAEAAITRVQSELGPVFAVVLRDVSDQRRADGLVRRLLAETEDAVRTRDDLLGLVSHDLRNPVTAIKMLAGAILRMSAQGEAMPRAVEEHADVMLQAARQMDTLIQDLLDVSGLESGRMRLVTRPIDAADTVRIAVSTMTPLAEANGVTLQSTLARGLPSFHADPDRLSQLLSNLIGNAIKFSPAGSTVRITVSRVDDDLCFTVIDEGSGIAAEELPRVFDRFWQSKRLNRSGAGLGLAIARGIVRAHRGQIWLESTLGVGTTAYFSLPIDFVSERDASAQAVPARRPRGHGRPGEA